MNIEWIKTSDRLPEEGSLVLCASKSMPTKDGWDFYTERLFGFYYEILRYLDNSFDYFFYDDDVEKTCYIHVKDVQYWMPLATLTDTVMSCEWINVDKELPACKLPVLGMSDAKCGDEDAYYTGSCCSEDEGLYLSRVLYYSKVYYYSGEWSGETIWTDYSPSNYLASCNTWSVTHWISLRDVAIIPTWVRKARVIPGGRYSRPRIEGIRINTPKLKIIQGG